MIEGLKPYPSYRQASLPWLPSVPCDWGVQRGKNLFRESALPVRDGDGVVTCFRDGQVTLRTNRRTSGFTNAILEGGYQGVRQGQLVIHAMDAFAGAVGVSDSDGKCTPEYAVCDPMTNANPQYYAWLLREAARLKYILIECSAVRERAPRFRYPTFGNMGFPVPPPDEQAAIVKFIDHADRRIRKYIRAKQKLIKLLEEQKQAIIHQAVTRGLDPNVRLKPSGLEWLGDVPEHWDVGAVKHAARVLRGKFTHRPRNDPALYDGPYPFVQTGQVAQAQKFITSYSQTLNERGLAVSKMFPRGTLTMTIAANIGHVAILDFDACFPDSVVGFGPRRHVERDFLYYAFLAMRPELLREAPVNTQGNLNIDRIASQKLPLPPVGEQLKIAGQIESDCSKLKVTQDRAASGIALLRQYRTRLIADVVTGKLDVRQAVAALPDVTEADEPDLDELNDDVEVEDTDPTDEESDE